MCLPVDWLIPAWRAGTITPLSSVLGPNCHHIRRRHPVDSENLLPYASACCFQGSVTILWQWLFVFMPVTVCVTVGVCVLAEQWGCRLTHVSCVSFLRSDCRLFTGDMLVCVLLPVHVLPVRSVCERLLFVCAVSDDCLHSVPYQRLYLSISICAWVCMLECSLNPCCSPCYETCSR